MLSSRTYMSRILIQKLLKLNLSILSLNYRGRVWYGPFGMKVLLQFVCCLYVLTSTMRIFRHRDSRGHRGVWYNLYVAYMRLLLV